MYKQFYGFSERPFDITPDPRFLYLTLGHKEALASMIYGVTERKGFISVTGEVGTGKTLLIYCLLKNLDPKVKTIHVSHTDLTFEQLLKTITLKLGLPMTGGSECFLLLHQLGEHLLRRLSLGGNVALIIDEAHNLSKEVMEEIRMLSNLETPQEKLLQILLVGQPELEVKLNSEDMRQFKQRIGIRRRIRPLTESECDDYIDHRLRVAGSKLSDVFTRQALTLIYRYSRGIPRTINIICDNAFLIGFSLSEKRINSTIVGEVITDLGGEVEKPQPKSPIHRDDVDDRGNPAEEARKLRLLNGYLRQIRAKGQSAG